MFQKKILHHLPLLIFHIIFLAILLLNFPFGSSFIGWDSINPEFNFGLNFQRALNATWQENYGTGTLTGHGFAGTLPHTIITYLMSFILPLSSIRPTFTFLMLYLGGLGMYILMQYLLHFASQNAKRKTQNYNENHKSQPTNYSPFAIRHSPFIALLSSLYYILNLGTIQMFYVQLETFIAHFASLPWLFLMVIKLLEKTTPKRLLIFCLVLFLASLQGFIPSLFISFIIALSIFLFAYLFTHRFTLHSIKKVGLIILLTGLINSFWLLPVVIYQQTQNNAFLTSYNNLTSTQHFIDVNKKYGTATDVMLLKGYLFDAYQLGDYILRPWIDHLNTVIPTIIGYIFFAMVIVGILFSIFRIRHWATNGLALIFLFFIASIATNTQPFSSVIGVLQWISPTYEQAFRTAFTKFSIGNSFTYSIFFGIAAAFILNKLQKIIGKKSQYLFYLLLIGALFVYSFPVFGGNLLYSKLKISLPAPYFSVMDYFKTQGDGRIADFPQECADGWYAYKWGYFGSGFYWYGVKQPVLSRSFDVWSKNNENYYWEVTTALNKEDFPSVLKVLEKYHVRWILYDPNAYYCNSQRGILTHQAFIEFLKNSPEYKLSQSFKDDGVSPILIFESTDQKRANYTTLSTTFKNIGPNSLRTENDSAYAFDGTYLSTEEAPLTAYYPFKDLLTKRGEKPAGIDLSSDENYITISSNLPSGISGYKMSIKKYAEIEQVIPTKIKITKNSESDTYNLTLLLKTPEILLDNKKIWGKNLTLQLGSIDLSEKDIVVKINGQERPLSKKENTYDGVLLTNLENTINIYDKNKNQLLSWQSANDPGYVNFTQTTETITLPSYKKNLLTVKIPKIIDQESYGVSAKNELSSMLPIPCNELTPSQRNTFESKSAPDSYIRLISQNSSQCLNFYFTKLFTNNAYLVDITSRNITGNKAKINVYQTGRTIYGSHHINSSNSFTDSYMILPPAHKNGIGYDLQIINLSENNTKSINDFANIKLSYLPYQFLKEIRFAKSTALLPSVFTTTTVSSSHPNDTRYEIASNSLPNTNSLLILNQSFHPGWNAYILTKSNNVILNWFQDLLPSLFGKKLQNHTEVNSWENGWLVSPQNNPKTKIIIIFTPQYLQYFGFILLILTPLTLLVLSLRASKALPR